MKIAVCGGTLSGITISRLLASSHTVDLHCALNDPARSIHRPHPLCEYGALTFPVRASDDNQIVRSEVDSWIKQGYVLPCYAETRPKLKVFDAKRGTVSDLDSVSDGTTIDRYQPKSGFFTLLKSLIRDLPKTVNVRNEQLIAMDQRKDGWYLTPSERSDAGPYDLVLFAYDSSPRASRKASFKQLLESGLPHTSPVIGSLAGAVSASAMTVIACFNPPLNVDFDVVRLDGVPELRFASRNNLGDAALRGIKHQKGDDVWTLMATPEWSYQVRQSHGGKWDKKQVGKDIVSAFGKVVKKPNLGDSFRSVVPTFHWQGASLLTTVCDGELPFAFDSDAKIGFCGDVYGGQGVEGALKSAHALARHVKESRQSTNIPSKGSWTLRDAKKYDDDTNAITGSFTGRDEPKDGLDHTWPTAVDIANGKKVQRADSLAKYRKKTKKSGGRTRNGNDASRVSQKSN